MIFQPQSGKIMVTRDVQFLDDEQWDWNEESRVNITIIHTLIMMNWWMISLLGEQGHSLISIRDAILLFLNLQYMRKQKLIKNGQMQWRT